MQQWTRLMQYAYVFMLAWQLVWLGLLPPPTGPQNTWLAVIACLPLLLPLMGVLRANHRSMVYGGIVLMIYFAAGVMEMWTNPAHRWPGMVQIMVVILYVAAFRRRVQANTDSG